MLIPAPCQDSKQQVSGRHTLTPSWQVGAIHGGINKVPGQHYMTMAGWLAGCSSFWKSRPECCTNALCGFTPFYEFFSFGSQCSFTPAIALISGYSYYLSRLILAMPTTLGQGCGAVRHLAVRLVLSQTRNLRRGCCRDEA
jgi:hypothetical protein